MISYYRIMLGKKSVYAKECFEGNFIGTDFGIHQDLSSELSGDFRTFNRAFSPIYLQLHPEKKKVAAGLACSALWTVSKGLQDGDIVLCPDGEGHYHVGKIEGSYTYQPNDILPHRRTVKWFDQIIDRASMSEALRNSTGSIGTVSNISDHGTEIQKLLGDISLPANVSTDEIIEDPIVFRMEEYLEDFLVNNWSQTPLAREYEIYQEDGESGRQYLADKGRIDILAISKDKKTLLVIELKRGRASDVVVGQILRYMGYVKEELAEEGQIVRGAIIALEDDHHIHRALAIVPNIDFYLYQVSFKLLKA